MDLQAKILFKQSCDRSVGCFWDGWLDERLVNFNTVNPDIRWRQRFQNYEKALSLLREALAQRATLSQLEKEGTVQRFEFTLELGWNSLKDYLEYQGVVLEPRTPRNVIKQAFAAKIIRDGQLWIDMLEWRNLMSHNYDKTRLEEVLRQLTERFLPAFDELLSFLGSRSAS